MSTLTQMRKNLEGLRNGLIEIVAETMMEHRNEIVALLVYQQFEEGIDSQGEPLREYSFAYKTEKRRLTGSDNTNLELTGDFHSSMNLHVDAASDEFDFESPSVTDTGELKITWLARWNRQKGGGDIMTLTPENKARIWPIIESDVRRKVDERLSFD